MVALGRDRKSTEFVLDTDGLTPEPLPIMCYEYDGITKSIYQLQTTKLRNCLYEVKFIWYEGHRDGYSLG